MKTLTLICTVAILAIFGTTASRPAWAADAEHMDLARQMTRLVFPKDKIIETHAQMAGSRSEHQTPESIRKMLTQYFDYSLVEKPIAEVYADIFSVDELEELVAFQKKDVARLAMQIIEKLPASKKPQKVPMSPPSDTKYSRAVAAFRFAKCLMDKELVIKALEQTLANQSPEKRREVMQNVKQLFDNPEKLRKMQLAKAGEFVFFMTTKQLEEVADFYETPTGKKLLANNLRVGKAAVAAAEKESLRASEVYMNESKEKLRDAVRRWNRGEK